MTDDPNLRAIIESLREYGHKGDLDAVPMLRTHAQLAAQSLEAVDAILTRWGFDATALQERQTRDSEGRALSAIAIARLEYVDELVSALAKTTKGIKVA